MTTVDWKRKLSSRKLWVAVAGVISGLVVVFGGDAGAITDVAGAVVAVASALSYVIVEGKIDEAAALRGVADRLSAAAGALEEVTE